MAEASIPVDLLNPGQVFACLGFLEAAEILLGDARGGFDWTDETDIRFRLAANGETNPFESAIEFLLNSEGFAVSPIAGVSERDKGPTIVEAGVFPCRLAKRSGVIRNSVLPIELRQGDKRIRIDYWADFDTGRPYLHLWTATNGNSAWVRFEKLRDALRKGVSELNEATSNPFDIAGVVGANFRLELRRNWISLDLGFSPDKLSKGPASLHVAVVTYPLVELFAAFGLGNARPRERPGGMEWQYSAWSTLLPVELARVALAQASSICAVRHFRMLLEQPNDGGDLSISNAFEDSEND